MKRDLREYARQTNIQMAVGAAVLLIVVGIGLIWWIYGEGAASLALICALAGLSPVVLIVFLFWAIDWILRIVRPK